jgi:hypothetical protein
MQDIQTLSEDMSKSAAASADITPHTTPVAVIEGRAAIVRHHILNNRRQVLTEDTTGRLALWDVLHGIAQSSTCTAVHMCAC